MKHAIKLAMGVVILLTGACGPSPEQVATMTASAWTATPEPTSTPLPTLTPTPVPYDLTVKVTDTDGAPVVGANVVFPESGDNGLVAADDAGQVTWSNLSGPNGSLTVTAQGYLPGGQSLNLERGPNEVSVKLERDPFGLLPAEACGAGEKLLYAEDFQDKRAAGWNEIDLKTPGWDMAPSTEEAGNIILSAQYNDMLGDQGLNSRLDALEFENAVWRTRFLISKTFATQENWFSFNWKSALQPFDLNGQEIFDSRYQLPVGMNYFALRRLQQPATNIGIGQTNGPKAGEWHLAEISTYQGVTEVWLDGIRLLSYEDPLPIPPGTIGLELRLKGSDSIVYFDNISVCELSAPFTSITPAAP